MSAYLTFEIASSQACTHSCRGTQRGSYACLGPMEWCKRQLRPPSNENLYSISRPYVQYFTPLCTVFHAPMYSILRPLCTVFHAPMYSISRHYVQYFTVLCTVFHAPMYSISRHYVQYFTPPMYSISLQLARTADENLYSTVEPTPRVHSYVRAVHRSRDG